MQVQDVFGQLSGYLDSGKKRTKGKLMDHYITKGLPPKEEPPKEDEEGMEEEAVRCSPFSMSLRRTLVLDYEIIKDLFLSR